MSRQRIVTRVLVVASGHSVDEAAEVGEVDYNAKLGSFVVIASTLAFFVGLLLVHYASPPPKGSGAIALHWTRAVGVGVFFAAAVFAVDRWIVSVVYDRDSWQIRLFTTIARLAITIPLALAAAWSVILVSAGPLIANQLALDKQAEAAKLTASPALQAIVTADQNQQTDAQRLLATQQAKVGTDNFNLVTAQQTLSAEEQGHAASHIAGCGIACHSDNSVVGLDTMTLHVDEAALPGLRQSLISDQRAVTLAETRVANDLAERRQKVLDSPSDIFARHDALGQVERHNPSVRDFVLMIEAIIIGIDLTPALFKGLAPRSATDEAAVTARARHRDRLSSWRQADTAARANAAPAMAAAVERAIAVEIELEDARTDLNRTVGLGQVANEPRVGQRFWATTPGKGSLRRGKTTTTAAVVVLVATAAAGAGLGLDNLAGSHAGNPTVLHLAGGGELLDPAGTISNNAAVKASDQPQVPGWAEHVALSPAINFKTTGKLVGTPTLEFPVPAADSGDAASGVAEIAYLSGRTWVPYPASYDPANHMMTAQLVHFSTWEFWDWDWASIGARISQDLLEQVGERSNEVPSCTNGVPTPSWYNTNAGIIADPSEPIRSCLQGHPGDSTVDVEMVNDRPYGMVLTYPSGSNIRWGWHESPSDASSSLRDSFEDVLAGSHALYLPPLLAASVGLGQQPDGADLDYVIGPDAETVTGDVFSAVADTILAGTTSTVAGAIGSATAAQASSDCAVAFSDWTPDANLSVSSAESLLTATILPCIGDAMQGVLQAVESTGKVDGQALDDLSGIKSDLSAGIKIFATVANLVSYGEDIAHLGDGIIDHEAAWVPGLGYGFSILTHYTYTGPTNSSSSSTTTGNSSHSSASAGPLSLAIAGSCTSSGGALSSVSSGFTPGGTDSISATYPNGQPYTNIIDHGRVNSSGSIAWYWPCAGDPAGTYATTVTDNSTGRSVTADFTIGAPSQSTGTTTTTTTTVPPPPPTTTGTEGFVIDDSIYGGTWARTDPNDGTWYPHSQPPPNAAYWYPNGLGVAVSCAEPAASYSAVVNGQHQTWNWWAHVTDGKWVPTVVFSSVWANGDPTGLAVC